MLEKSLKVLNDILVDFEKRYNYYDSINSNSDLKEIENEINIMLKVVFSENTKLLLFEQLIIDIHKDKNHVLYNFYVHESRDLLRKHSFKNLIYGSWYKLIENYGERELSYTDEYSGDYSPLIYKIKEFSNKINPTSSFSELKIIYYDIIKWYAQDIDMLAYSPFTIKNPKFNEYEHFTPFDGSDEYIQMWYNGSITLDIWRKYPNTGFLKIMDFLYSENYIKNANILQLQLYNQAIDIELNSLRNNISNSPVDVQKVNIARQLSLIQKFTLGNFSDLDFQRISQIIVFDRPNEVILAYDDIIRFDNYDFTKIIPYDGDNLRKSPRFVADLLIKYEQFLIEQSVLLENLENKELPKIINKPKPKNFGFNKRKKLQVLRDVLTELQLKYDLIENDFDDLINVLTHNDYTTIPFTIKISCQTNIFTYILKEIVFCFSNLNSTSIQNSGRFITKKEGKPLLSSNFNKSANSLQEYKKEEIDKILIKLKE